MLSGFLDCIELLAEQGEVDGNLLAVGPGGLRDGPNGATHGVDDGAEVVVDLGGGDVLELAEAFEPFGDPALVAAFDRRHEIVKSVVVAEPPAELILRTGAGRGAHDGGQNCTNGDETAPKGPTTTR